MKYFLCIVSFSFCIIYNCRAQTKQNAATKFFAADNPYIQYTGRVDFSNPAKPRFWAPGVYMQAKFKGTYCTVSLQDEVLYGNNHNYIEIVVDHSKPVRLKLKDSMNIITAAENLNEGEHTITICKNTESGIGYLELIGFNCDALLPLPAKPLHKIEFIGNSITCGTGSDLSVLPCGQGQWYDQHNAYMSYGPVTARALNAQWSLSAVSGIGLIHSCCDMNVTMPQVFDKVNMRDDSLAWNFSNYIPDVVTITLGQNDGIQDSIKFCNAYISFIALLRTHYPDAHIICLTSPMADEKLKAVLKNYLSGIVRFVNNRGDKKVYKYFYSKSFNNGCGGHPDLAQHQQIAAELTAFIKKNMNW